MKTWRWEDPITGNLLDANPFQSSEGMDQVEIRTRRPGVGGPWTVRLDQAGWLQLRRFIDAQFTPSGTCTTRWRGNCGRLHTCSRPRGHLDLDVIKGKIKYHAGKHVAFRPDDGVPVSWTHPDVTCHPGYCEATP